jgi:hypothetical protein
MRLLRLALLAVFCAGCAVPYSVGSTATTAAPGAIVQRSTIQFAAGQPDLSPEAGQTDPTTTTASFDQEVRFGLDEYSDAGVRLVGLDGVVASYRRRLGTIGALNMAGTIGAGVLGLGSHAHAEGTLVASPEPTTPITPYGGIRVQALAPLDDDPAPPVAMGFFGGVRLARGDIAIFPELGIFYAPNDLLGVPDWILVPSLTVAGDRLLQALGIGG